SLIQAAAITPDGDPLKTEFLNSWSSNINYVYTKYIAQPNNPMGFMKAYGSYNSNDPYYQAAWQDDFLTFAWGYAAELSLNVPAGDQTKLAQFYNWKATSIINRLGTGGPTGFWYADAAQYIIATAPLASSNWDTGAGPWYSNWGQIYTAIQTNNPNGNC